MKVFVDENIPATCVQHLRGKGHEVIDIRGTDQEGLRDENLWDQVQQEGALLITTDKGFTRYRQKEHHGILIMSLRQPNKRKILERLIFALESFPPDQWPGLLAVVRDTVVSTWRWKAME